MKKRIIALSVAAALGGFAGAASAQFTYTVPRDGVNVPAAQSLVFNDRGVGHILYVPYFSTQEGNVTAINIVNTDTFAGKVLKVRFRGASNSDDLYDFQVFLSPGDVWTAAVTKNANGLSQLTTSDKSCTLPANVNGTFIDTRISPTGGAAETREGYVEILTMADILPGDAKGLYKATKHVKGVAPCTSSVLTGIIGGDWFARTATDFNADEYMSVPTTGIMANWTIINVDKIVAYSGDAVAIEARTTSGMPGWGNLVYWDQRSKKLEVDEWTYNTADPLIRSEAIIGARYDLPDLSTPYLPNPAGYGVDCPFCQAAALSDSIAAYEVAGEFYSEPTVGAETDWVISFPTRRYYTAVDYANKNKQVFNAQNSTNPYFNADNTEMGSVSGAGKAYQICSIFGVDAVAFYDREETPVIVDDIVISPGTPTSLSICGEVSVVGVNVGASTATFGSVARTNATNGFKEGWGSLTAPSAAGMPMLARQFTRVNNTQTNVYYGLSYPARVTVKGVPPLPPS